MLILGDVANPCDSLDIDELPENEIVLINCEGYLVENEAEKFTGVYNNVTFLSQLRNKSKQLIVSVANNHILDVPHGIKDTLELTDRHSFLTTGGGKDLSEAEKPLLLNEDDQEIAVISAGWDVIGCIHAKKNKFGVGPLQEFNLLKRLEAVRSKGRKIIVYLHWGYETEIYPLPIHRDLARKLIDNGADIVIGCHSHCMNGFELYNGKYIFYSIGNAIFKQGFYHGGKLTFPKICDTGLAIDWNPETNTVSVHEISFDGAKVSFQNRSQPEDNAKLVSLSQFNNLGEKEYISFFRKNRRKKVFLPVFYEPDTSLMYKLKVMFVGFRHLIISALYKLRLKGSSK